MRRNAKRSPYFPHDLNARGDEKILKMIYERGWEYYGIYWAIIEKLHEAGGYLSKDYTLIAYDLRTPVEPIKAIVEDYGLFDLNGVKFTSVRVLDNIEFRMERSESGTKGMASRWGNRYTLDNSANSSVNNSANNSKVNKVNKEKKERVLAPLLFESFPYLKEKDFKVLFLDYLDMRQKIRKPATDKAIQMILDKLGRYEFKEAKLMLRNSIENSWAGVFRIKDEQRAFIHKDKPKPRIEEQPRPPTPEEQAELDRLMAETRGKA